jgi:hypothetical protein
MLPAAARHSEHKSITSTDIAARVKHQLQCNRAVDAHTLSHVCWRLRMLALNDKSMLATETSSSGQQHLAAL